MPYSPETLDPHRRDRVAEYATAGHFYEALVRLDPEMTVRPGLAVRWVNPDEFTWLFSLRPGVLFQDGASLTARDVIWTLERLLSGGKQGRPLGTAHYVRGIRSVAARDPLTVEIRTERPVAVLLNKLALVPVVKEGTPDEELHSQVNGTGPYRLARWRPGEELSVVQNEVYWGERPDFQKAVFRLLRPNEKAMDDIASGASDIVVCPARGIESLVKKRDDFVLLRRTGLFLKYLAYDMWRKDSPHVSVKPNPFLSPLVRSAISLAIDRPRLAASLPVPAVPAYQLVPPAIFGYDPTMKAEDEDIEKAKRLLGEAGYSTGFDVTLHVRELLAPAVPQLGRMLGAVGIRVKPVVLRDDEFYALVMRREASLILNRFGCLSGDVSDLLDAAIHSVDEPRHFGSSSFGAYSNPELDKLIEGSSEVLESSTRLVKLQQIVRRLREELPWIPLYFDEDVYAVKTRVEWSPRADSSVLAHEIHPKR